jgi:hypothetical protein
MAMARIPQPETDAVLRELDALAQGEHPEWQSPIERFLQCEDWQQASNMVARALDASLRRSGRGAPLSPPPGWLPPVA